MRWASKRGRRAGRPRTAACAGRGGARGSRRSGSSRRAPRAPDRRASARRRARVAEQRAGERLAAARFPTPAGPWKRYACAGPRRARPRAAASPRVAPGRQRRRSGSPPRSRRSARVRRRRRTDPGSVGELAIHLDDQRPELAAARSIRSPLSPTRATAVSRSISTRTVRSGITRRRRSGSVEDVSTPSRGRALIGDRGVEVAIADHRRPALERRTDHLVDVLCPRRRVERGFRRAPRGRRGGRVRGRLAERGPAGLARRDDFTPPPRARRTRSRACVVLPEPSRPRR